MPKIYLSPSTQDWNMYVTNSGSEEYNMNLPGGRPGAVPARPTASSSSRNRPEMTAGSSIREANSGGVRPVSGPPLQRRPGGAVRRGAGDHRLLLPRLRRRGAGGGADRG